MSVKENRVTALDLKTGDVLTSLPVGAGPTHLAVNSDTGMIYVCNTGANSVTVLDGRALKVRATIPVGDYPFPVAVDPARRFLYMTMKSDNRLAVFPAS